MSGRIEMNNTSRTAGMRNNDGAERSNRPVNVPRLPVVWGKDPRPDPGWFGPWVSLIDAIHLSFYIKTGVIDCKYLIPAGLIGQLVPAIRDLFGSGGRIVFTRQERGQCGIQDGAFITR